MHFFKEITEKPGKNTGVLHTTYKDNVFLDKPYIDRLESLIDQDETYHKIYALGECAPLVGVRGKKT